MYLKKKTTKTFQNYHSIYKKHYCTVEHCTVSLHRIIARVRIDHSDVDKTASGKKLCRKREVLAFNALKRRPEGRSSNRWLAG